MPDHLSVFMSYQAERETLKMHYRALPLCHSCTQITDVRRLPSQLRLFKIHIHLSVISKSVLKVFSVGNLTADVARFQLCFIVVTFFSNVPPTVKLRQSLTRVRVEI